MNLIYKPAKTSRCCTCHKILPKGEQCYTDHFNLSGKENHRVCVQCEKKYRQIISVVPKENSNGWNICQECKEPKLTALHIITTYSPFDQETIEKYKLLTKQLSPTYIVLCYSCYQKKYPLSTEKYLSFFANSYLYIPYDKKK